MNEKVILSYAKLWKLLIDKKINKTQLKEMAKISTNAVAKMGRDESVSLETLSKVCYILDCNIGDIIEISFDRNIDMGGQMGELKYYDIHMLVDDDCKAGYSIFIKASSVNDALEIIRKEELYEDENDLECIDYIGEISEQEYNIANNN